MFRVFFGGIVGGIVAFVWAFVSWGVLPWHSWAINKFKNPDFVTWVVKENATVDGVYMAPYTQTDDVNLTPGEIKQEIEQQEAAMKKGPYVFAQVRTKGMDPSHPSLYIYSFLTQFAGAFLISWLLYKVVDTSYGGRLFFVTMIGLIVGVLGLLPDWNWFGAGYKFTLIMMADYLIQWFIVGIFLAAFVKPREVKERELMM